MLTEKDITEMCQNICIQVGVDFTIPVIINKRLTHTLGRVCYLKDFSRYLTATKMEISHLLLETATAESIKSVIQHECAHYLVCQMTHTDHGHDIIFKKMCHAIGCTNDGTVCNNLKYAIPEEKVYKYFVTCKDCGSIVAKYHRACKTVQHPELYKCGKCGGSLKVIKNQSNIIKEV